MRSSISTLPAADAQFLRLEDESTLMTGIGILILDPSAPDRRASVDDMLEQVRMRARAIPRLRQRVEHVPLGLGRPVFADDPSFDIDYHVRGETLPGPGEHREFVQLIETMAANPLDRARPLWQATIVDGFRNGCVAFALTVHHALMDGIGGLGILHTMFDPVPQPTSPPPVDALSVRRSRWDVLAHAIADRARNPVGTAGEVFAGVLHAGTVVRHPRIRRAKEPLLGAWNGPRRRWVATGLPLAEVKMIARSLDVTVNDVVLTLVAEAIHHLLDRRGAATNGLSCRALVPVSIRAGNDADFGNRISYFLVDLPIGLETAAARVRGVASLTLERKRALAASRSWRRRLPPTLRGITRETEELHRTIDLTVSNVSGPAKPMFLAGARTMATYSVPPLTKNAAISVSAMSLGDSLGVSFSARWDAVPDVDALIDGVHNGFATLRSAVDAVGAVIYDSPYLPT